VNPISERATNHCRRQSFLWLHSASRPHPKSTPSGFFVVLVSRQGARR
jgi:hypothetical protein